MYYIATYDVGTTAVKGVLVSSAGEIETSESVQIKTYFEEELKNYEPSLEVEEAESAIYNHDLTDVTDIIAEILREHR